MSLKSLLADIYIYNYILNFYQLLLQPIFRNSEKILYLHCFLFSVTCFFSTEKRMCHFFTGTLYERQKLKYSSLQGHFLLFDKSLNSDEIAWHSIFIAFLSFWWIWFLKVGNSEVMILRNSPSYEISRATMWFINFSSCATQVSVRRWVSWYHFLAFSYFDSSMSFDSFTWFSKWFLRTTGNESGNNKSIMFHKILKLFPQLICTNN